MNKENGLRWSSKKYFICISCSLWKCNGCVLVHRTTVKDLQIADPNCRGLHNGWLLNSW